MFRLANEFAAVEITRDDCGNGPRLMVRDLASGRRILLDPLELSALATASHAELMTFLDPARLESPDRH